MNKELKFSAKFDTADFDKSVEAMQKKLKDIYAPADMVRAQTQQNARLSQLGIQGNNPQATEAAARTAQSSRRELEMALRSEAAGQEKLGKFIAQRTEKTKELKQAQEQMIKGSEKELELKTKIAKIEENTNRQREIYMGRAQALTKMAEVAYNAREQGPMHGPASPNLGGPMQGPRRYDYRDANGMMDAYRNGGINAAGSWAKDNKFAAGMGILGGVTGLVGGMGLAAEKFTGYGQRLEAAGGTAVANSTGSDLADVYGGRSTYEGAYKDERTQAAGLAAQKADRNRVTDRMKGIGSVGLLAGGVIAGAASLAATPFTMGGSAVGLPVAGAMIAGGIAGLSGDRARQGIFGGKEYDKLIAAEQSTDFRTNYDNLKNQDPAKKLAMESYEQNRQRDISMQRMLGLNDQNYYKEGGFQSKATAAGFRPDQAMGMASSIIGAGGSSRMGNNAAFGLQMERTGLTNAGGVLGSLSGSIQSPEATKRATISIMAEAFKIGLDDTDFAEENRKFTAAAANIISRSGASSEGDQDKITAALGQFLGERTNQGVQSAQDAYERSQERGSSLAGRRGAMRFSAARQNSNLGKLETNELTELLGARPEDVRSDSSAMRAFAKQAGYESVEEMKGDLDKINKDTRFLTPSIRGKVDKNQQVVSDYMKSSGKSYSEIAEMSRTPGKLPDEVDMAYGKLQIATNVEEKGGFKASAAEAAVGEMLPQNLLTKRLMKQEADARLESNGDRLSDQVTKSAAEGAEEARKSFSGMIDSLKGATAAAQEFSNAATGIGGSLSDTAKLRQQAGQKGDPFLRDIATPNVQPQARKSK